MALQWVYLSMYVIKMFATLHIFLQEPYSSCFSYDVYLNVSVTCCAKRGNNVYDTHIREDCCKTCTAICMHRRQPDIFKVHTSRWGVIPILIRAKKNYLRVQKIRRVEVHFWKIVTNSKIKRKPSSTSSHSNTTAGGNSLKWIRTKDGLFLITCFCHCSVRSGDFSRAWHFKKNMPCMCGIVYERKIYNHMVVYSDLSVVSWCNINEVRS